ncbi:MAG TPA: diphosphomevalonate decarboxylase [Thermoanaerobaculales bacterium]|nr:diphosphomevalonate decarboxylase [Thermoanaerobaculales bacterium]HPA81039.1 diphosphomevalonate decarboxylase [Thermoanaerobaculales bacterium]HQL29537.1 diphosphomevalonate decarboxylase [Thermoanaerobaculales bacterium]HQN95939.1 diphosphomevalonate decarboxylase [Thermoanaerobaculales bacterium]
MHATAVAHPNIALVKYWGKADEARNLPAVGSISITLDTLVTTTSVRFDRALPNDRFTLDGRPAPDQLPRVRSCLDLLRARLPGAPRAAVESTNSFPTAAGLASSASGFAALVVAADHALGTGLERAELAEQARRCSGSAARSLFGGFVELRLRPGSRCETGQILAAADWQLQVVIAVTSAEAKAIGSTAGMLHTERTSPYYGAWLATSEGDLAAARRAIEDRDFAALAAVAEHSCLKMHAVMLASRPGLLYWNGTTVECLRRLRELASHGVGVFFTVDAGPQVKAVCLPEAAGRVAEALAELPGVTEVLRCGLGEGARVVGE